MVTTHPALNVQYTSAQLNGSTDVSDPSIVQEIAFLISKTDDFITTTKIVIPFDYGNVNKLVLGLEANQVYFFRLQVTYVGGNIEQGVVLSFQTLVNNTGGLNTRPHIMTWIMPGTPGGTDPETGYPLPDEPGIALEVPCRFHLGGTNVFKNEDSTDVNQIGSIRIDAGQTLPLPGTHVEVLDHFDGIVRAVYKGQLTHRIDV